MSSVSARYCHDGIVALFSLVLAFILPISAFAQAPKADPKLEAAKTAYEALPENDRKAIQEALVWTGDYSGVADGSFGRRTFEAIVAFETKAKLRTDGIVGSKEKTALEAAAQKSKQSFNFRPFTDPRNGIRIGIPARILDKVGATKAGTRLSNADGSATLETLSLTDDEASLPALFDKHKAEAPKRKVTYKVLHPEWFVVSGEDQGRQFYTRIAKNAQGAGGLKGFTFSYVTNRKAELDRVTIAIANSFDPFPGSDVAGSSTQGAPAPRALIANGLVVAPGRVLTVASLEGCAEATVAGGKARLVRADKALGLALLEAATPSKDAAIELRADPAASHDSLVTIGYAELAGARTVSVASGEAALVAGKLRVVAPLQREAAGSAVFDRSGALAGVVERSGPEPRMVAGVVPQASYAMIGAGDIGRFLAASGVNASNSPKGTVRSTGEIVAAVARSVVLVECTPAVPRP